MLRVAGWGGAGAVHGEVWTRGAKQSEADLRPRADSLRSGPRNPSRCDALPAPPANHIGAILSAPPRPGPAPPRPACGGILVWLLAGL